MMSKTEPKKRKSPKKTKRTVSKRGRNGEGRQPDAAIKWPTPEERKQACERFCDHVSQGYSEKSWPEASPETVTRYIKDFPEDFDADMIDQARRQSIFFWEGLGIRGVQGKIEGFNNAAWIFNMKNRLGWKDRIDHTSGDQPIYLVTDPEDDDF